MKKLVFKVFIFLKENLFHHVSQIRGQSYNLVFDSMKNHSDWLYIQRSIFSRFLKGRVFLRKKNIFENFQAESDILTDGINVTLSETCMCMI